MQRNRLMFVAVVAVAASAAAGATGAAAQEEIKITIISGHPPAATSVMNVRDTFIPGIDKRLAATGKYKINWTQAYAGTVAKPPGVLKALQDGVADFAHLPHLFNADKLPLEQVTFAAPFGTDSAIAMARAIRKLRQQAPEMDLELAKLKVKQLAVIPTDGYNIIATVPITKLDDLKGVKLGTGGPAAAWINGTGAVSVAGTLPTYYNSIQTGVYEGAIVFETAVKQYKFYEVAKYVNTVGFGAMYASMIATNTNRWKSLPEEVRQAVTAEAANYETIISKAYEESGSGALKFAVEKGAKIVNFPSAERVRLAAALPNIAKQWAADAEKKGLPGKKVLQAYVAALREIGEKPARDWDKY